MLQNKDLVRESLAANPPVGSPITRMTPAELLDKVSDRDSFITFVNSLASEREQAEQLERDDPRYQWGGAHNWQNSSISSFLHASLAYFDPKPFHEPETAPSWKMLADFLYYGKIYE